MKISNYSLNYSSLLAAGKMDIPGFLSLCRELDLEGASLHLQNLTRTDSDYLKQIRRVYLDSGLSVSMFTVRPDSTAASEKSDALSVFLLTGPLRRD